MVPVKGLKFQKQVRLFGERSYHNEKMFKNKEKKKIQRQKSVLTSKFFSCFGKDEGNIWTKWILQLFGFICLLRTLGSLLFQLILSQVIINIRKNDDGRFQISGMSLLQDENGVLQERVLVHDHHLLIWVEEENYFPENQIKNLERSTS